MNKLYTVDEVAALASVTPRTIRNYLKSGRLNGRKIGGQWRFSEEEVQRLLSGEEPALQPVSSSDAPVNDNMPSNIIEFSTDSFLNANYEPSPGSDILSVDNETEQPTAALPHTVLPPTPHSPNPAEYPQEKENEQGTPPQPAVQNSPPPQKQAPGPIRQPFPPYEAPEHSPPTYMPPYQYPPTQPYQSSAVYAPTPYMTSTTSGTSTPNVSLYFSPVTAPQQTNQAPPPAEKMYYHQAPQYQQPPYPQYPQYPPVYNPPPTNESYYPPPEQPPKREPASKTSVNKDFVSEVPVHEVSISQPQPPDNLAHNVEPPPEQPDKGSAIPMYDLSDIGNQVAMFASEVHDCSSGPRVCCMIDLHQSLASAKITSERLIEIAEQESNMSVSCQCYVEFDSRYYIARYTLIGSSDFLLRCLKMIG